MGEKGNSRLKTFNSFLKVMTFQTILHEIKEKGFHEKKIQTKFSFYKKLSRYHLHLNKLGENSRLVSIAAWLWKAFPVKKHYLT